MRIVLAAGLALALPGALHAESLTFGQAIERAASDAPSLRAREAGVKAARSEAIAADRLPDPTLELGIRDFPVTGPDAGRINSDDFTMRTIGVTQEFTNPAKRRAQIHRSIAETIESYFGDRSDEFASALALHFRHAGEPRKAAQYYLLAARRASAVFAYEEARNCYVNALEQLAACGHDEPDADDSARAEAHVGQADILTQHGEHAAARAQYETALSLIGEREPIFRASIHRKYGRGLIAQRLSAEALESAAKAMVALESSIGPRALAWWHERIEIHIDRIWAYYWSGDNRNLRLIEGSVREEMNEHGDVDQKSRYYLCIVLILFREENLNISDGTLSKAFEAKELARRARAFSTAAESRGIPAGVIF